MSFGIAGKLADRVEVLRQNLISGLPFEKALEMLPAISAASAEKPSKKARALTGSHVSNQSFDDLHDVPSFDGGFDGGSVTNYFGKWVDPKIFDVFDTWKTSAKNYNDRKEDYFVTYKGIRFLVLPYGSNRGVNFRFILKTRGFTFLIFGKPESGELPSVQVDYSYESLRNRTIFDARIEVEEILSALGLRWEKVTFQRIDINVTLAFSFDKINKAFQESRIVSRVRSFDINVSNKSCGQYVTYYRGGGAVQICLYDKFQELCNQYNELKYNDLLHVIGDGRDLTRVEFRLFSEFFRSLEIYSFEELENQFPSIVEYLCCDWFRILEKKKVRGRENKQKLDIYWRYVQYAFFKTFIKLEDTRPIIRRKRNNINNVRLLSQAVGCVSSALARSFDSALDIDAFINHVFDMCLRYKHLAYRLYEKKKRRYEAQIPSNGFGLFSPTGVVG